MTKKEFASKMYLLAEQMSYFVDLYEDEELSVKAEDIEWINEAANELSDMADSYDELRTNN